MGVSRDHVKARPPVTDPRWLRFDAYVLTVPARLVYRGQASSSAPVLAVLSPWPTITAVLWWIIGLAGLWLGLLRVAMAVGLAQVLRSRRRNTGSLLAHAGRYRSSPTNRRLR